MTAEHARHIIEIIEAGYLSASPAQVQELTETFECGGQPPSDRDEPELEDHAAVGGRTNRP